MEMTDKTEGNEETDSWVDIVLDTLCYCFRTKPKFKPLDAIKRFCSKTKGKSRESYDISPETEEKLVVTLEQLEKDPEYQKIVSEPIPLAEKLRKTLLLRKRRINELIAIEKAVEVLDISESSPLPQSGPKLTHAELENDPEYHKIMLEPIGLPEKLNKVMLLRDQRQKERPLIEPNNRVVPQSNAESAESSQKRKAVMRPTEPPPPPPSNTSPGKSEDEGRGGKWNKKKAPSPPAD